MKATPAIAERLDTLLHYTQTSNGKIKSLKRTWVLRWYTAAQLTDM